MDMLHWLLLLFCVILAAALAWALVRSREGVAQAGQALADAERQVEQLRRAARHQARLLGYVSHELRSPLQSVAMSVDLLASRIHNEENRNIITRLETAAEQITAQMEDLAVFAHLQSGQLVSRPVPCDPHALLESLRDTLSEAARRKGQALVMEPPMERHTVLLDARRFKQIVTNLLTNAIKYAVPGKVFLGLCYYSGKEGLVLELTIEDEGPGIAPDVLPVIFNAFSQMEGATEGVGLGMSIVGRLVDLMGGVISVSSPPGAGAKFIVRFPVALARQ